MMLIQMMKEKLYQKEIEQINNEIDRISDQTEFNTQSAY